MAKDIIMAIAPEKRDTGERPVAPDGNVRERLVDLSIVYDDTGAISSVNMRFERFTQDASGAVLQSLGVAGTPLPAGKASQVAQFETAADNFLRACTKARDHQVAGTGPFAGHRPDT